MVQTIKKKIKRLIRRWIGDHPVSLEELPDSPALFQIYRNLLKTGHMRAQGGWIYEGEFYPDYLLVGGNTFAIRRVALKYCIGNGIDVGASFWPLPGSIPIDTELGPGVHNRIEDVAQRSQDYVFSSHCLEHIVDWQSVLDCWLGKLKTGGVIFLYLPHPSCKLWHMSNPQMGDTHKWAPTPEIIRSALTTRGLELLDADDGPDHFFSFYIVAKKS